MWVLNIYPNTGSNIVGAENRRQAGSLGTAVEGGGGRRQGWGVKRGNGGGRKREVQPVRKKERKGC